MDRNDRKIIRYGGLQTKKLKKTGTLIRKAKYLFEEEQWVALCVHQNKLAFLEWYSASSEIDKHEPLQIRDLFECLFVNLSVTDDRCFIIGFIDEKKPVMEFAARNNDDAREWVDTIKTTLKKLNHLADCDNEYQVMPIQQRAETDVYESVGPGMIKASTTSPSTLATSRRSPINGTPVRERAIYNLNAEIPLPMASSGAPAIPPRPGTTDPIIIPKKNGCYSPPSSPPSSPPLSIKPSANLLASSPPRRLKKDSICSISDTDLPPRLPPRRATLLSETSPLGEDEIVAEVEGENYHVPDNFNSLPRSPPPPTPPPRLPPKRWSQPKEPEGVRIASNVAIPLPKTSTEPLPRRHQYDFPIGSPPTSPATIAFDSLPKDHNDDDNNFFHERGSSISPIPKIRHSKKAKNMDEISTGTTVSSSTNTTTSSSTGTTNYYATPQLQQQPKIAINNNYNDNQPIHMKFSFPESSIASTSEESVYNRSSRLSHDLTRMSLISSSTEDSNGSTKSQPNDYYGSSRLSPPPLPPKTLASSSNSINYAGAFREQGAVEKEVALSLSICVEDLLLVEVAGSVWIAGWNEEKNISLQNIIHFGDQLIEIHGKPLRSISQLPALFYANHVPGVPIPLKLKCTPHGTAYRLTKPINVYTPRTFGIIFHKKKNRIEEIIPLTPAAKAGLCNRQPPFLYGRDTVSAVITEIDGIPLNPFSANEEFYKLLEKCAVGSEIRIVIHPYDFIKLIKQQLKELKAIKKPSKTEVIQKFLS